MCWYVIVSNVGLCGSRVALKLPTPFEGGAVEYEVPGLANISTNGAIELTDSLLLTAGSLLLVVVSLLLVVAI